MSVRNRIKRICEVCQKEFEVTASAVRYRPARFCSQKCTGRATSLGLIKRPFTILHLKCENCGKEYEIPRKNVGRLGKRKYCTWDCWLQVRQKGIKTRSNSLIASRGCSRRRAKHESCQICGFSRFIEACYLRPISQGGSLEKENRIYLCPNHHRLFDNHLLLPDELLKLPDNTALLYNSGLSYPYSKLKGM